ncbi:MAG: class III signal peptide-containing protein [Candidatus Hydrothermarchaeaceae archaeon]
MWGLKSFLSLDRAQVSLEFILLTGGVVVAALAIFSLQGTISSFANVSSSWVETERNSTITKITR